MKRWKEYRMKVEENLKRWWDAGIWADVPWCAEKRDLEAAYRDGFERGWEEASNLLDQRTQSEDG